MTGNVADPAGRVIASRYEIVRPLGSGAFGHTFLARGTESRLSFQSPPVTL